MDSPFALDEEIVRTEQHLLSLRQRKNREALTIRLPLEVLAHIFSFLSASNWPAHRMITKPPTWLSVTHVCRHWRDTALSFPSLWSEIVLTNKNWMYETLERSKDVSISLQYSLSREWALEALSQIHRTRQLTILDDTLTSVYIPRILDQPAPLLEIIWLKSNFLYPKTPASDLRELKLFAGVVPNLHTLRLENCIISPESPLIHPNLTSLSLISLPPQSRFTKHGLLDILRVLPRLEELTLTHVLPITGRSGYSQPKPSETPLELPAMKQLCVTSHSDKDIAIFMWRLSIPVNASVRFQLGSLFFEEAALNHQAGGDAEEGGQDLTSADGPDADNIDMADVQDEQDSTPRPSASLELPLIVQVIRSHILSSTGSPRDGASPVRSLALHNLLGYSYYFSSHAFQDTIELRPNDTSPWPSTLSLLAEPLKTEEEGRQHFTLLTEMLPLSDLHSLYLDSDLFLGRSDWESIFAGSTQITRIVARRLDAHGVIRALKLSLQHPALFPNLAHLTLGDIRLDRETMMIIASALYDRQRHSMPLRSLRLERCDVTSAYVDYLGQFVLDRTVGWDEEEKGWSEWLESVA
ncbi:hypothetical protein OF83DRAFT_1281386 [Amylostereum chailletii]|nr:hypothetical protein OF83DRAFT_1281386 [Amylostereum chailletii]